MFRNNVFHFESVHQFLMLDSAKNYKKLERLGRLY